jgi:hypothetical protein
MIVKNINQAFAEDLTPERFATFVAVVCEEGNDQVELLSAGHGPIFVYSSDNQSFRLMNAQALPLGILPDLWDAVPVKLSMRPSDIVLLITDGFFEWENSAGEEFGTERLAAVVRQFSDRDPQSDYRRALRLSAEFCPGNSAERRSHCSPDQENLDGGLPRSPPAIGDTCYAVCADRYARRLASCAKGHFLFQERVEIISLTQAQL